MNLWICQLLTRYPVLASCAEALETAADLLIQSFTHGGKLLVCGNGGSCADAEHIVGELMKGFARMRPLDAGWRNRFREADRETGDVLAARLQMPLKAISLQGFPALSTAFANDVDPVYVYAQQAFALTDPGDVFMGISTSGNAANVHAAAVAAKVKGAALLGLTGADGGRMNGMYDCLIKVPAKETYRIQELHLPVYHALCMAVEAHFFNI